MIRVTNFKTIFVVLVEICYNYTSCITLQERYEYLGSYCAYTTLRPHKKIKHVTLRNVVTKNPQTEKYMFNGYIM